MPSGGWAFNIINRHTAYICELFNKHKAVRLMNPDFGRRDHGYLRFLAYTLGLPAGGDSRSQMCPRPFQTLDWRLTSHACPALQPAHLAAFLQGLP